MEENRSRDAQKAFVDSVNTLIDKKIKSNNTTTSKIGIVQGVPSGFSVDVKVGENSYLCSIPEHLHTWIFEGDVVTIQDLYNNGQNRVIVSKQGSIYDDEVNLLYDSNTKIGTTSYLAYTYDMVKNIEEGQTVTLTWEGSAPIGQRFGWYNSNGNISVGGAKSDSEDVKVYQTTFKWRRKIVSGDSTFTDSDPQRLLLYNLPNNTTSMKINWVKLVEGDKSSLQWKQAPLNKVYMQEHVRKLVNRNKEFNIKHNIGATTVFVKAYDYQTKEPLSFTFEYVDGNEIKITFTENLKATAEVRIMG